MAIVVDGPNSIITVNQTDTDILTSLGGTLYSCDTDAIRLELKEWEANQTGIVWPDTHKHDTESTISGTVYVRKISILAPYKIRFLPDSQWTVTMDGASNNNYHDVGDNILVQNQVQVIPANSAGNTITEGALSAQQEQDLTDILVNILRARKVLTNRQELVDTGSDIRLRTWEDDGSTVLEENIVTDDNDNDPDLTAGAATKRGISQ